MGRQLYRSAKKFMVEALSNLSTDTETVQTAIVSSVAQDETENTAVEKTLKVMAMQGHVHKTGDGPTATYRLSESGVAMLNALGGS